VTVERLFSLSRIFFRTVFRETSFWAIPLGMAHTSRIVGPYVATAETGIPIHGLFEVGVFKGKKNSRGAARDRDAGDQPTADDVRVRA
jgi:hypothetical protein